MTRGSGASYIATATQRAEELGYDGVWVNDRVLWPTSPKAPFPAGMARIAARADGWTPAGVPVPVMNEMYQGIRAIADAGGRDAGEIGATEVFI